MTYVNALNTGTSPVYLYNVIPGTSGAGQALVLDSSGNIDNVPFTQIETAGTFVNTLMTSNYAANLATVVSISTSVTLLAATTTFTFTNYLSSNISWSGWIYLSGSNGYAVNPTVSYSATLGNINSSVAIPLLNVITDSSSIGKFELTSTFTGTGTYYWTVIMPNGQPFLSPSFTLT